MSARQREERGAGILFRPKNWPEAVWAALGSVLLVALGLRPPSQAGPAVLRGTDVYLFVAQLARQEGVFVWPAGLAVRASRGRARLFALVYAVGLRVTGSEPGAF